jgi:hypothetical protein
MLSIASKNLSKKRHLWVTPQKVIKDAVKSGLLTNAFFRPSNEKYIKRLLKRLEDAEETDFLDVSSYKDTKSIQALKFSHNPKIRSLEKKLLHVYSEYNYIHNDSARDIYIEARRKIEYENEEDILVIPHAEKDTKQTYNTSGDIQISLSYLRKQSENYYALDFLPASNTLYDDNRGESGESDLRLTELGLLINQNTFRIEKFNLYSLKSLLPWNAFTEDASYALELNYKNHYDQSLDAFKVYNISIGKGYTRELSENLFVYSMINVGVGYGKHKLYPYLFPEAGVIFYETDYTKTVLEYRYIYNQLASRIFYHDINFVQSFFMDENYSFHFNINAKKSEKKSKTEYTLSLHYFF